nr:SGNH/GDSL hydrolase family protein [Streptomyces sp. SID5468]
MAVLTSAALLPAPVALAAPGHPDPARPHPVAPVVTWAASAQRLGAVTPGRTYRFIVHTSTAGRTPRLRLSNVFGDHPVTLGPVYAGVRDRGAAVRRGGNRPVTFGGATTVTIAPGAYRSSDPVALTVPAHADLAVSLYVRAATGPGTGHVLAYQTSYAATGDHARQDRPDGYTTTLTSWYYLDSVAVTAPRGRASTAVAALGDSITDGANSTPDTNRRWPDLLAARLRADPTAPAEGVANEGISGNRLLHDGTGPSALSRLDRDVLTQPGVRTVIVLEGVNDIKYGTTGATAAELVAGFRRLLTAAHTAHRCVVAATVLPFGGFPAWTPARERVRRQVNEFLRRSGEFDAVADFDRAVRDPRQPDRMDTAYDSGDHLHPDDAGMRALAGAIAPAALRCTR